MKYILSFLVVVISLQSLAQPELVKEPTKQFSMFYGNDVSAQRDLYFTNGWIFEYVHPVFSKSPFKIKFFKNKDNIQSYHSVRLIYDVFTPDLHKELLTDRPFAAYVLVGSKHQFVNPASNIRITSEWQLGVIGGAA